MKKMLFFLVTIVMVTAIVSCEKDSANNDLAVITKSRTASGPASDNEVVPYIISGANRGGNRTCNEVATEFGLAPNPFTCGEKIDYVFVEGDGDGDYYEWDGMFPEWLEVTVAEDGEISFKVLYGCHKIGAVIVKGSNKANVYYYGVNGTVTGTTEDSGLYAPGGKMVSNITFCCLPCEEEEDLYIAVKMWYWLSPDYYTWAASDGSAVAGFFGTWCTDYMGINVFPTASNVPITLLEGWNNTPRGGFTITPGGNMIVNLTSSTAIIDKVYVFIGTLEELLSTIGPDANGTDGCPLYDTNPLWQSFDAPDNSNEFNFAVVL